MSLPICLCFPATLAYAHDLGMTKPDGTVLLALMNGKFTPAQRDHLPPARLTHDPVRNRSRLYSWSPTPWLPIRQDISSTSHLALLLWNRVVVHLSLGLRHKHRNAHRLCRHVWSAWFELFGTVDQAHHRDCS